MKVATWTEEYARRTASAQQAVGLVASGDHVVVTGRSRPELLERELAGRVERGELTGIRISPTDRAPERAPSVPSIEFKALDERGARPPDAALVVVSPPDGDGFCSFGHYSLTKRSLCRRARRVIAEVNANITHMGRESALHVTEIDALVPHDGEVWELEPLESPSPAVVRIAGFVKELIRDGDTIEMGIGATINCLHALKVFEGRRDLGIHTGGTRPGLVDDIKAGIFTGARKTYDKGLMVAGAFYPKERSEIQFVKESRAFAFRDLEAVNNIAAVAAHDNFVAINSAVSIDLSGQISAEGERDGGGLTAFAVGAVLSRGGRSIIALPSTARSGTVSRIVPQLPAGQGITVPRTFADIIVTEHGVAHLLGKSFAERAKALIAIADDRFREELSSWAKGESLL